MDLRPDEKRLTLSVGELSRLVTDEIYSPSPVAFSFRGKLGANAHREYQSRRSQDKRFRQEVHLDVILPLEDAALRDWTVRVRGRLDGLVQELDRDVIEELKTLALPPQRFTQLSLEHFPRHRRQLEIYLHLLTLDQHPKPLVGQLIYLNLVDQRRKSFEIDYNRESINAFLQQEVTALIRQELRRQQEREEKEQVASQIRFPFKKYRRGQEAISGDILGSLQSRTPILLEAPTGLGKTAAVLFAALPYALRAGKQILFLTSKNTQQDHVFQTAIRLKDAHRFPRLIWLRARQKLCPLEADRCSSQECEYLENFNERSHQPALWEELLSETTLHPDRLQEIGLREKLCPHELQRIITAEADLIIGDYNYVFDPSVQLEPLFSMGDPRRLILIVDEAHNLPDRARSYYTRQLSLTDLHAALEQLESDHYKPLRQLMMTIQAQFHYYLAQAPKYPEPHPILLSVEGWQKVGDELENAFLPYWFTALERASSIEDDPVVLWYRQFNDLLRILKLEGDHFAHLLRRTPQPILEVTCLDASRYLGETFSSVHSSVCLSATLQPFDFYRQRLGLSGNAETCAYESPFPREHCRVFIDPSVTTLYREREAQVEGIAQKIEQFHALVQCNTLVFFPSFNFLRRVNERLRIDNRLIQEEGLSDRERQKLLTTFKKSRKALLCAVLGGVFAEGIDLPGRLAEAVIVVGVGLPQVCTENELMRAYYDRQGLEGFNYAYLYPGMRRVIQAAGRLIRRESDRGILLLLDRRFTQRDYQVLLPRHWYCQHPSELVCLNWHEEIASNDFFLKPIPSHERHEIAL